MKLFRNGFWLNLLPVLVHYHPSDTDRMIFPFIIAVLSFALAYVLAWFLVLPFSLFCKNHLREKRRVYAFYFSILALFANNIISLAIYLAVELFKIDLLEDFDFMLFISYGTTPFFAILLLVWLVIFLVRRKLKNREKTIPQYYI